MSDSSKFTLCTGGTGFIGRHVVKRLVDAGRRVLVTGREPVPLGAELISLNFQDVSYETLADCETVIHLAAETNTRAPDHEQWKVNCEDAADFLRMCRESDVKRIVYASSCAVYGRGPAPFGEDRENLEPLNAYGAAKLALDKLVSAWAVGIRPTNVYGPGETHKGEGASFVGTVGRKVSGGEPVTLFSTCQRDLVSVDDVADVFCAAEAFAPGVYNCGTGIPVDYLSVVVEFGRIMKKLTQIERKTCPFPFEFQEYTSVATGKLARALPWRWQPKSWREAIRDYVSTGWITDPTV